MKQYFSGSQLVFTFGVVMCILSSCSITIENTSFYFFCNPHMVEAKYKAIDDDWIGAMEIWGYMVENGDDKLASRAAYNMAIGCEFMDRKDLAMEWARIAAFGFESVNTKALVYLDKLENLTLEEMRTQYVITER